MIKLFITCVLFSFVSNSYADKFSNAYIEFTLPNGWECAIEGSEWVCQSTSAKLKKEAIIVLGAKKKGPQDTIQEYENYLKQIKSYKISSTKTQRSDVKLVKKQKIRGQEWVDALHLASEVPGFYTRYLATVNEELGVAVTFSVAKDKYNDYKGVFDNLIASMKIFKTLNAKTPIFDITKKDNDTEVDIWAPPVEVIEEPDTISRGFQVPLSPQNMIILILGVLLFITIMKVKKMEKRKKVRKKRS